MKNFPRFVVLLAFCVLLLSNATRSNAQGFKFGPVVGEDFAGSESLPSPFAGTSGQGASGYILGLRTETDLIGPIGVQAELLLTQRSFKDDYTIPSGSPTGGSPQQTLSWAEKLQYLQIPILLKITPFGGAFQPYIFAGPNIGFKLSASAITDSTGTSQSADQSTLFHSLDLGLDVGGGIQFRIFPFLWLFGDVRYTYGLMDAYTHAQQSNLGNLSDRDIKWMTGFMVGF